MTQPSSIGPFTVDRLLGSGGFATVWLATDPMLEVSVAIKVLAENWSQDLAVRRRFLEEARLLWKANDNRLVRVHQVSELPDGRPYFVMTWADRGTLADRLKQRSEQQRPFSPSEARSIATEIAEGVQVVHDLGSIHRDVKPTNILLRTVPPHQSWSPILGLAHDEQLMLADLGLAKSLDSSAFTMVAGSPAYIAPEQAAALPIDVQADVFAIGSIFFELLTGESPHNISSISDARNRRPVPVLDGELAEPELQAIINHTLDPDPGQRFASAAELAQALRGEVIVPIAPTQTSLPVIHAAHAEGHLRKWLLGLSIAAIVLAVGSVLILTRDVPESPKPERTPSTATSVVANSQPQIDVNTIPLEFGGVSLPTPEGTVLRHIGINEDGNTTAELLIDSDVTDVVDFYRSLNDLLWIVDDVTPEDQLVLVRMKRDGTAAELTISNGASSATSGITRILVILIKQT